MKRNLLILAGLALSAIQLLWAQEPNGAAPPLNLNINVSTGLISVPPVAGTPFSAVVEVKNVRTLSDGTVETIRTVNWIGRDSRGRTHGEQRGMIPASSADVPALVEIHIYDPETQMRTVYHVPTHTVRQYKSSSIGGGPSTPSQQISIEDLGFMTVQDFVARGTRRTFTIPAEKSGTGAPLSIADEYWYSDDLHLNLLMRHSDPRLGVRTFTATQIRREEPPVSFFEPDGYRVVSSSADAAR